MPVESLINALAIPLPQNPDLVCAEALVAVTPEETLCHSDDAALIARAQAGDTTAFEALVHRYDRDVLRLVYRIVQNPDITRDLYQEAFLKVYRNIGRFRLDSSFYTWLYRVVTNVCLDHLRRRRSRPEEQAPAIHLNESDHSQTADFFENQQDASVDPEQRVLGEEIGSRIRNAMKCLSPRERMIFAMKHSQGMKLKAIGDVLGTSEESVKNSLFRATRKLREQLQDCR
jgi:RNA polymerase sigma-70 factor (ECF subfamily)